MNRNDGPQCELVKCTDKSIGTMFNQMKEQMSNLEERIRDLAIILKPILKEELKKCKEEYHDDIEGISPLYHEMYDFLFRLQKANENIKDIHSDINL